MDDKLKYLIGALFVFMMGALFLAKNRERAEEFDASACVGLPFRSAGERQEAMETGYTINQRYDCIDQAAFDETQRNEQAQYAERRQRAQEQSERATKPVVSQAVQGLALAQARKGFRTELSIANDAPLKLPEPPPELFVRSDYRSGDFTLPAFVTPRPSDGQKHAAIIWLTGGDSNSLDNFWTEGGLSNDQSASAFRKAGNVMFFPTLRGGNAGGSKEYFFGEVEDVLAAADHLATMSYVDPSQIYLGGHSTGGTLALLAAEISSRFAAVIAFGPVAQVDQYPTSLFPGVPGRFADQEVRLRSPIHWLHGIGTPTYLIEGAKLPSNADSLRELCGLKLANVHCIAVPGHDHFSVLGKVTPILAARIAVQAGAETLLKQAEFE